MINTGLDTKHKAKEPVDYSPVPDGTYLCEAVKIDPWEAKKLNVNVIKRDENGYPLKDSKGKNETEMVRDCEFYSANVRFKVLEGEHKGKFIFETITTHPNMQFTISRLLYALGMNELEARDIPKKCINKKCLVTTYIHAYEKKVIDKNTGLDSIEKKEINKVRSLKAAPQSANTEATNEGFDPALGL